MGNNCKGLAINGFTYQKETSFLGAFERERKPYFPEKRLPTPADRGKLWVNGIGFLDEAMAVEMIREEANPDTVEHVRRDLEDFARKRIAIRMEERRVKQGGGENFFPMTPPQVSRNINSAEPIDSSPAARPQESTGDNGACNPDIVGTALYNSMNVTTGCSPALPHITSAAPTMSGTYENACGKFEVSGPFALGGAYTLTVRQINTDGSVTTGTLTPNSQDEWEGNLVNRGSIFGHIRLACTENGALVSTFRALGSSSWGAVMQATKV